MICRHSEKTLYERQLEETKRTREELDKKKEEQTLEQLKEATFSPAIPESSKVLARKRSSQIIDVNGGSVTGNGDVYHRLSVYNPSPHISENSFFSNGPGSFIPPAPNSEVRKSIILPERVLSQVFERLATPSVTQFEEHLLEAEKEKEKKKVVLPEKEVDQIFNRLNVTRTMSFTFKYDDDHEPKKSPTPLRGQANPTTNTPGELSFADRFLTPKPSQSNVMQAPESPKATTDAQTTGPAASAASTPASANKKPEPASAPKQTPRKTGSNIPKAMTPSSAAKPAPTSAAKSASKVRSTSNTGATVKRDPPKGAKSGAGALASPDKVLPTPPPKKKAMMPPAPPATTIKTPGAQANATNKPDSYYDDLAKKLEASLNLINQNTNNATPAAKEHDITGSPLAKDAEDFINSIPLVPEHELNEESD
jgi:hypothetical protein